MAKAGPSSVNQQPKQAPSTESGNLFSALDGSLSLYYSRELAGDDQGTIQRFSSDGGETWTAPYTMS